MTSSLVDVVAQPVDWPTDGRDWAANGRLPAANPPVLAVAEDPNGTAVRLVPNARPIAAHARRARAAVRLPAIVVGVDDHPAEHVLAPARPPPTVTTRAGRSP
jgi:hypothetical protein